MLMSPASSWHYRAEPTKLSSPRCESIDLNKLGPADASSMPGQLALTVYWPSHLAIWTLKSLSRDLHKDFPFIGTQMS